MMLPDVFLEWVYKGRRDIPSLEYQDLVARKREGPTDLVRRTLDETSSLLPYLQKDPREYIKGAKHLLADWLETNGEEYGFSRELDLEPCLRRALLIQEERTRLQTLINISRILSGNQSTDSGRARLYYRVGDDTRVLKVSQHSAIYYFGRVGNEVNDPFSGLDGGNLPWDYVLTRAADVFTVDEGRLNIGSLDLLRDLYKGKIGELSDKSRVMMGELDVVVLTGYGHFGIESLERREDTRILYVPAKYPWEEESAPNKVFRDFVIPSMEHELKHLGDLKCLDGVPYNDIVLELRALTEQLASILRNSNDVREKSKVRKLLRAYLGIIRGEGSLVDLHFFYPMSRDLRFAYSDLESESQRRLEDAVRRVN
ncbi:MAG: hypothetical protein GF368_02785 [Candidatus Aenigmarchaeota archaeon]|nr:hypothetical protein [Candidatus Aenigmarchaeota archaeon]